MHSNNVHIARRGGADETAKNSHVVVVIQLAGLDAHGVSLQGVGG